MRHRGFTLVELMIVVAILAIIASIAIPNLLSARLQANESAAISTLRSIVSAQSQLRTQAAIDQDLDSRGEHGWLGELAGTVALRNDTGPNGGAVLQPPVLPASQGFVNAQGHINNSGYFFRVCLPDASGAPLSELESGSPGGEGADLCELFWIAYAWPAGFGTTGRRAFVVNQTGTLLQTNNRSANGSYSGTAGGQAIVPAGDAAIVDTSAGSITGELSISSSPSDANDGNDWFVLN